MAKHKIYKKDYINIKHKHLNKLINILILKLYYFNVLIKIVFLKQNIKLNNNQDNLN